MTLLTVIAIIYFCLLFGLLVGFLISKKGSSAKQVFGILTLVFWSITLVYWLISKIDFSPWMN